MDSKKELNGRLALVACGLSGSMVYILSVHPTN